MSAVNFSTEGLDRLRERLVDHVDRRHATAVVSIVARGGKVHLESVGRTALEGGAAVGPDTIFRISSMTKPITAVATLLLVQEGVFGLDDDIEPWLPELADRRVLRHLEGPLDDTVPAERSITVRDLLTFRLGFGAHFASCPIVDAATALDIATGPPQPSLPPPPDEWLRRFGTLPLMCQPGERWLYNTGSELLGVLIARASGQSFDSFLRERIFLPLGMTDTTFVVGDRDLPRFTTSYATDRETGALTVYDEPAGQWHVAPAFPSGASGLAATAPDYLAFAQMLLGGGAPLLERSFVEAMTTDQLTPAQKAISGLLPGDFDARGWGLGVSVVTAPGEPSAPVGQYGWSGGMGSIWCNDPANELILILMSNAMWTSPQPPQLIQDFLDDAYAALGD